MTTLNYRKISLIHILTLFFLILWLIGPAEGVQAATISGLYNTGVNDSGTALSPTDTEIHYSMTGPASAGPVEILYPHPNWVTAPSGSAWIGPNNDNDNDNNGNQGAPEGDYWYTLSFDLTNFNLSTVSISGQWTTDNAGWIYINDIDTGFSRPAVEAFLSLANFTVNSNFIPGINTLTFKVNNALDEPNPSGLIVANLSGTGSVVPIPAAVWLLGSGLIGIVGIRRKYNK